MPRTAVFIGDDVLGGGDAELGRALLLSALKNLHRAGDLPSHVLFMNAGVRLCCTGSAALDDLRGLAGAGVELLCCGTCLDWFELKDALSVGRESNMVEILTVMNGAARVVRL